MCYFYCDLNHIYNFLNDALLLKERLIIKLHITNEKGVKELYHVKTFVYNFFNDL